MKNFKSLEMRLAKAGNGNPKRSAEELVAAGLGCKPLEIYFLEPMPEQERTIETLMVRAERGEPIQYIIGRVDFRGLELLCDRRALIPRPETELLVDQVLSRVHHSEFRHSTQIHMADVGTGTGCIGLALLAELSNAVVTAVDLSPDALKLACENADRLGLRPRFQPLENNLLEGFTHHSLDIIVSNPPYISSSVCKSLEPCVRDFEPALALDGGEDGLQLIRPLVNQSVRVLKPGGWLFLEIGYDQGASVSHELEQAGLQNVRVIQDLAGLDRIVLGSAAPY